MTDDRLDQTPKEASDSKMTWIVSMGNEAVRDILAENRRLGIPSAFEFRGGLVFEMPDGTLTMDDPFTDRTETPGSP